MIFPATKLHGESLVTADSPTSWDPSGLVDPGDWRNVEFFIHQVVGGKRSLDMDSGWWFGT